MRACDNCDGEWQPVGRSDFAIGRICNQMQPIGYATLYGRMSGSADDCPSVSLDTHPAQSGRPNDREGRIICATLHCGAPPHSGDDVVVVVAVVAVLVRMRAVWQHPMSACDVRSLIKACLYKNYAH